MSLSLPHTQKQSEALGTKKPPSTPWMHPLRHIAMLREDMPAYLQDVRQQYGPLVRLHNFFRKIYLVNEPDYIQQVLVTQGHNFTKDRVLKMVREFVLGDGLLTNEGEFHRRQRKLIAPAFRKKHIATYAQAMVDFSERLAQQWQGGETVDMAQEMMRLTLGIVAKTLFDSDVDSEADEIGDALTECLEFFPWLIGPLAPLRVRLPTPARKRFQGALERIDTTVLRIIQEHRDASEDSGSLLSLLLQAQYEDDGSVMTDKQVRDEAITLFLAGHETTANALAWTWYRLSQHPAIFDAMVQEIDAVWARDLAPYERFQQLKFTRDVLAESMRLHPPAHTIGRRTLQDFQLGPYTIPAGAMVVMSPYSMHRDPRFWDDPEEFRPSRWSDGSTDNLPKFAYFPFGGGARVCIGEHFAWMEGVLILATLARRWHPTLVPGQTVQHLAHITLRPRDGVMMQLQPRPTS